MAMSTGYLTKKLMYLVKLSFNTLPARNFSPKNSSPLLYQIHSQSRLVPCLQIEQLLELIFLISI